jgi:hypothetical protein
MGLTILSPFQGLGCFGHINPRAALRFALGYHLAPLWGKRPSIATWVPNATRGSVGAGDGGEGREG